MIISRAAITFLDVSVLYTVMNATLRHFPSQLPTGSPAKLHADYLVGSCSRARRLDDSAVRLTCPTTVHT